MEKKTELEIISEVKSKWIEFIINKRLPKTVVISVRAKEGDELLGRIFWYSRWRCYVFEPDSSTIYEKVCMRDIANLLDLLTANQRRKK